MDIEDHEEDCADCVDHRERVIKNMSPEGLALCLEKELETVTESLDFLNRKSEAMKASIAKLKQP